RLAGCEFGLVETASDADAASFFDNLFHIRQGFGIGGLVRNVGLIDHISRRPSRRIDGVQQLNASTTNDHAGSDKQYRLQHFTSPYFAHGGRACASRPKLYSASRNSLSPISTMIGPTSWSR